MDIFFYFDCDVNVVTTVIITNVTIVIGYSMLLVLMFLFCNYFYIFLIGFISLKLHFDIPI